MNQFCVILFKNMRRHIDKEKEISGQFSRNN